MSRSSSVAVVALVALLTGRAWADQPTPPPDDTTATKPPEDDRDHDRDLDHDTTHRPDPEPKHPTEPVGDPTDRPLFAPRLTRDAMHDIVVDTPGERSSLNIAVLAGMTTVALAGGVFGLYYHLQGRTAANSVSSSRFTGKVWMPADQAAVDKADRDRTRAIVLYSAGGAVLVAAIVALIATDPKSTRTVIHPHVAMIAPLPDGGVVVARGWTF